MSKNEKAADPPPEDARLSALYRLARSKGPSPEMDLRVLHQARRIAQRHRRRWLIPLASAAVVMLGLSLSLRIIYLDRPEGTGGREAEETSPRPASAPRRAAKPQPAGEDSNARAPARAPDPVRDAAPFTPAASVGGGAAAQRTKMRQPTTSDGDTLRSDPDQTAQQPLEWITRIRTLLAAGREQEARQALADLRRVYPTYPLPEDLARLNTPRRRSSGSAQKEVDIR